uniref:CobW C-terminal domain-containing protein n=1 Tax=Alexandrium monilatum TaxID=311494 RepID=A0A7S4T5H1_9DINO
MGCGASAKAAAIAPEGWALQPCLDSRMEGAPPVEIPKVRVLPSDTVAQLIKATERGFLQATKDGGNPLALQVNLLWTDNGTAASNTLDPQDRIERHFKSGDSFFVYGDVVPAAETPAQDRSSKAASKIPVLILTGFLGAGKTTLLNYLLQEQREKKIAVIENEFGEIPIDDELLQQNKLALAEKIVVMDNGCMCCTIRADLSKGLSQILEMSAKGNPVDSICIETTGMADPVPIVKTFMSQPDLCEELRLDGILAVADARNLPGRLDDNIEEGKINEAYQQIAFADKIILNKLDLVSTEAAITCKDRIRSINKFAKILPAVKGRVNISELVNLRAHDVSSLGDLDFEREAEVDVRLGGHGGGHGAGHEEGHGDGDCHGGCEDPYCTEDHGHGGGHGQSAGHGGHGAGHGHIHAHGESRHDTRVNSFALVREGELVEEKLGPWFTSLFSLPPERGTIFRIKGILGVKGYLNKRVFHAVMDAHDGEWAGPWREGEKKVSKIVFIGKALDQAFLRKGFEDCFE